MVARNANIRGNTRGNVRGNEEESNEEDEGERGLILRFMVFLIFQTIK